MDVIKLFVSNTLIDLIAYNKYDFTGRQIEVKKNFYDIHTYVAWTERRLGRLARGHIDTFFKNITTPDEFYASVEKIKNNPGLLLKISNELEATFPFLQRITDRRALVIAYIDMLEILYDTMQDPAFSKCAVEPRNVVLSPDSVCENLNGKNEVDKAGWISSTVLEQRKQDDQEVRSEDEKDEMETEDEVEKNEDKEIEKNEENGIEENEIEKNEDGKNEENEEENEIEKNEDEKNEDEENEDEENEIEKNEENGIEGDEIEENEKENEREKVEIEKNEDKKSKAGEVKETEIIKEDEMTPEKRCKELGIHRSKKDNIEQLLAQYNDGSIDLNKLTRPGLRGFIRKRWPGTVVPSRAKTRESLLSLIKKNHE